MNIFEGKRKKTRIFSRKRVGLSYKMILKGTGVNVGNFERSPRRHKNVASWVSQIYIHHEKVSILK